jgi:hypothetical protein
MTMRELILVNFIAPAIFVNAVKLRKTKEAYPLPGEYLQNKFNLIKKLILVYMY